MSLKRQIIFNFVFERIVEQGRPSYDASEDQCLYRSNDGCKCGIGWLIPDGNYTPDIEGTGVADPSVTKLIGLRFGRASGTFDTKFLDRIQCAHDRSTPSCARSKKDFVSVFIGHMRAIAGDYNLSTAVIDEHVSDHGVAQ